MWVQDYPTCEAQPTEVSWFIRTSHSLAWKGRYQTKQPFAPRRITRPPMYSTVTPPMFRHLKQSLTFPSPRFARYQDAARPPEALPYRLLKTASTRKINPLEYYRHRLFLQRLKAAAAASRKSRRRSAESGWLDETSAAFLSKKGYERKKIAGKYTGRSIPVWRERISFYRAPLKKRRLRRRDDSLTGGA